MKKIICVLLMVSTFTASAFAQHLVKYDSKNHPKAKGLWLTVKYPSNWNAQEGNRPNIVQKFVHQDGRLVEMLMLQVNTFPGEAAAALLSFTVKDWTEFLSLMDQDTKVSNVRKIKHEGEEGVLADVSVKGERAGKYFYNSSRIMVVIFNGKYIQQHCGVVGGIIDKNSIELRQKKNQDTVCHRFFNSLILMDKY